jgi:hypothetical protein
MNSRVQMFNFRAQHLKFTVSPASLCGITIQISIANVYVDGSLPVITRLLLIRC